MTLRDYQQEAVDFLLPLQRGFIQAPAGAGKTLIASTAAASKAKPGWKVTWLANTREQVEQGIAAIEKTEGPAGVEFEVCCVAADPDVSGSDIIIFDEAHHAPASTWADLIAQAKPDAIIWGFSATPWSGDTQRDEFLEQTFENFFIVERERVEESGHLIKGKVYVHDLDIPGQWDAEIETKVLTEVEKRFRQYPILRDNLKCMGLTSRIKSLKNKLLLKLGSAKYQQAATGRMLEADAAALGALELLQQLAQTIAERDGIVKKEHRARAQWTLTQEYLQANEARNSAVVQLATAEAATGESILVLVHSIEHGESLAARIPGAKLVHSKVGAKSRRELIDAFRVGTLRVLFATSLADEGLDVPRASRLILVSGGRSAGKLEQRAGRVLRPFADKNGGIIHDFKDQGMMFAHAQAKARFKVYDKLGYSPEIVSYREKAA
jgi:superfamily II DNA or RNA helicase